MSPEPPPARLPLLVGSLASACVLAIPLGFFAGAMGGEVESRHSASDSATMGAFAAAVGAGMALLVLLPRGCRVARRVRAAAGLAGLVQFLAALLVGGMIYAIMLPQAIPFVTALAAALALGVAAIAVWTRSALRAAGGVGGAGQEAA